MVDFSDPTALRVVGEYAGGLERVSRIVSDGDRIYVSDSVTGLRILDASDPNALFELGSFETGGICTDVAVSGRLAVLASNSGLYGYPLQIVDVQDAASPQLLATFGEHYGVANSVGVNGRTVFLDGPYRLVDISDPSHPFWRADVSQQSARMIIHSNLLVSLGQSSGLELFSASPPDSPAIPTRIGFASWFQGSFLNGHSLAAVRNLVLAVDSGGLAIIDISVPSAPRIVGAMRTGEMFDVAVSGNLAFVVEVDALRIIDIADPTAPVSVMTIPAPGKWEHIAVTRSSIFYSNPVYGIRVLRYPVTPRVVPLRPKPNQNISGPSFQIEWTADGITNGNWAFTLECSGQAPLPLSASVTSMGGGYWRATTQAPKGIPEGCDYQLRIRDQLAGAEASIALCLQPYLEALVSGSSITIRWPDRFADYSLYTASNPSGPWVLVSDGISDVPDFRSHTVTAVASSFFRLQK